MVSHTVGLTKEGDKGQEVWGLWRDKQTKMEAEERKRRDTKVS